MKYLKKFESISTNQYYYNISATDFLEYQEKGCVTISKSAVDIIRRYGIKGDLKSIGGCAPYFDIENKNNILYVIEIPDEYFIIRMRAFIFYKCDQLEGLEKCLKDVTNYAENIFESNELTKEYYKKICSASDVGRGETYEVYSNMFAKKVTFSEMATNIVHKHNIDGHIMSDGRFWLNIGGCIVENKDEWFYVFLNNYKIKETIYLCDQLEGLDKFLGDIKL